MDQKDHRVFYAEQKSKMVRKLLAIGYSLGYDRPRHAGEVGTEAKELNLQHVNAFFMSHGVVKKMITDMTLRELATSVTQFVAVQRETLKKV